MKTLAPYLNLGGRCEDRAWARLSEGGTVRLPLHEAFWGARFGILTDRFGVQWMPSCDLGRP
jgi:PhnB protein